MRAPTYRRRTRRTPYVRRTFPAAIASLRNGQYGNLVRTGNLGILNIPANSLRGYGVNNVSLNALPNFTEITSLYDEYRITRVVYRLVPISGSDAIHVASSVDFTDDTMPTQEENVLELGNAVVVPPKSTYVGSFVPRAEDKSKWYKTTDSGYGIVHGSIKTVVYATTSVGSVTNAYRVFMTLYISVRNNK